MRDKTYIAVPSQDDTDKEYVNKKEGFQCYERKGGRETQEDAVYWQKFERDKEPFATLSPDDIGQRLATTYKILDDKANR